MTQLNHKRTALFAAVLPLGSLAFAWSLLCAGSGLQDRVWGWLLLLGVTVLVGLFPVQIPGTRSVISITDAFIFTSVLLFGVYPSVILAGIDALLSTMRVTRRLSSNLFSFSVMSLSVFVSASIFERLAYRHPATGQIPAEQLIIPLAAMTLAHYLIDSGLVAAVTAFTHRKAVFKTWTDNFLWSSVTFFTGASAAAVIYIFVHSQGFVTFTVVFPILLITYYTYKIYMEKVEEKNRHIKEMSNVYLSTIEALTMAIDAKDQISYGHVRRVRVYALGLARLMGLNETEREGLKAAALLHDIGKLAIPEYILNKPGKLSPGEFEKVKSHTIIGSQILSNVKFPYPVIPMVRHHHEWWDGSGYPDGLAGEGIPAGARILAISDCYDAMRSSRPYHRAMTHEEAVTYIKSGRGSHFNPALVDTFLANLDDLSREADSVPADGPDNLKELSVVSEEVVQRDTAQSVLDSIASAHREALALYEMASVVGRSLSMEETIESILAKLEEFVPHTTSMVYLQEDSSDHARVRAARGLNEQHVVDMVVRLGEGATGWAIKHNRALYNFDPAMDLAGADGFDTSIYECAATFPLAVSERVLGAITFYSDVPNQYTIEHERVMGIVTHQASMALLNAVIYERTRESALTDALTGLPNSRYLEHAFTRRLNRGDSSLAVMLLDLDGFKSVNDRFGHAAGDRILKEAAQLLNKTLRADDMIARLGGDEFVVLATDGVDAENVESLKDRLRSSLELNEFKTRQHGESITLGLSIGHSIYPADGETLTSLLLHAAHQRMYANKAQRKRRGLRMVRRRPSGEISGLS